MRAFRRQHVISLTISFCIFNVNRNKKKEEWAGLSAQKEPVFVLSHHLLTADPVFVSTVAPACDLHVCYWSDELHYDFEMLVISVPSYKHSRWSGCIGRRQSFSSVNDRQGQQKKKPTTTGAKCASAQSYTSFHLYCYFSCYFACMSWQSENGKMCRIIISSSYIQNCYLELEETKELRLFPEFSLLGVSSAFPHVFELTCFSLESNYTLKPVCFGYTADADVSHPDFTKSQMETSMRGQSGAATKFTSLSVLFRPISGEDVTLSSPWIIHLAHIYIVCWVVKENGPKSCQVLKQAKALRLTHEGGCFKKSRKEV